jgi:hypothetical protein
MLAPPAIGVDHSAMKHPHDFIKPRCFIGPRQFKCAAHHSVRRAVYRPLVPAKPAPAMWKLIWIIICAKRQNRHRQCQHFAQV